MKRLSMILVLLAAVGLAAIAQQKAVHFKALQEFLPKKDLAGFTREKPTGSTNTAMGMTVSEASVKYTKPAKGEDDSDVYIEVKLTDMIGIPFGGMAAGLMQLHGADFENETEDGYEKSVTVKKNYRGLESADHGDWKNCKLTVGLGNRFLVSLEGYGFDDAKLLHALVDGIDLEKLEKTTGGK